MVIALGVQDFVDRKAICVCVWVGGERRRGGSPEKAWASASLHELVFSYHFHYWVYKRWIFSDNPGIIGLISTMNPRCSARTPPTWASRRRMQVGRGLGFTVGFRV